MVEVSGRALARTWATVSLAASQDESSPALYRAVHVEEYTTGVRLIATDSYWLAWAWVPEVGLEDLVALPVTSEPVQVQTVHDDDQRVAALLKHVGRQTAKNDDPDLTVSIDLTARVIDEARPTLSPELAPLRVLIEIPGRERVLASTVQGLPYPDWRKVIGTGFDAPPAGAPSVAIGGWVCEKLGKVARASGVHALHIDWLDDRRARWRLDDVEGLGHVARGVFMAIAHREQLDKEPDRIPDEDPTEPSLDVALAEHAAAGVVAGAAGKTRRKRPANAAPAPARKPAVKKPAVKKPAAKKGTTR